MAKKKPDKIMKFLKNMSKREKGLAIALIVAIAVCGCLAGELFLTVPQDLPEPPLSNRQFGYVQTGDGLVSAQEGLNIYLLDTGQGESIYILFPDGKNMLIDAGRGTAENQQATQTFLSFFTENEISALDYLMLTHSDADHCNMLDDIVEMLEVKKFYLNDYPVESASATYKKFHGLAVAEEGAEYVLIDEDGEVYYIESGEGAAKPYKMTIFSPGYNNSELPEGTNPDSPICILEYGGRKVLLTGDATKESEEYFIDWLDNPQGLDIDVLKVGHHGSKESTAESFLEYFTPEYALISCGEQNTYDHPSAMLMNRLFNYGIVTYRTNRHGTILLSIDSEGDMRFTTKFYAPPENNRFDLPTLYASQAAE